jgi:electron transfer flavoprotein beta subunit
VPAPGAKINITGDGLAVDATNLGFTTSPHEECAVEAAIQLTEQHGGAVTVLTVGPPESEEQLRYAASVGADSLVWIPTGGDAWDPQRTAAAITTAVLGLESRDGPFDLILFGNESADSGGFQVGIRVATRLVRPMVNGVKGIEPTDTGFDARRQIDGGFELYRLRGPVVLGVREGINLPRYPTMKGRLAARKVEIEQVVTDPGPGGLRRVRLRRPTETVSETTILGTGPDAAPLVVDLLDELGLLDLVGEAT